MKIINAYKLGFIEALRQKKNVTIIYAVTLVLALTATLPFKVVTTNNLGNRPQVNKLFSDFDFTVFMDLMNNYGDLIKPFITIIFWMSLFYFFFSVFFTGGILRAANEPNDKVTGKQFFGGCVKYFWRFLRLGLYVLLIQLVFAAILAFICGGIVAVVSDGNEPPIFYSLVIWVVLQLMVFWFWAIVSDYAKIFLVKDDSKKVWKALGMGLGFSVRKLFLVYPLYILLILLPIIISALYWWIDSVLGIKNNATLLLMLLIQQAIVWFRFFAKTWMLTAECKFFDVYYFVKTQPMQTQEILIEESL